MSVTITNAEFLAAIRAPSDACGYVPGDCVQWVCHFGSNSLWAGEPYTEHSLIEQPEENTYFTLSLLLPANGLLGRRKENFAALQCIVLDDVRTKASVPTLMPSWIIETSTGNEQWGYILEQPIVDLEDADKLINAIIKAGYCDPGAGSPSTRYMRLPVGSNSKPEHMANNNGLPVPHKLLHWQPLEYFTERAIIQGLMLETIEQLKPNSLAALTSPPL